ncbi:hypothetical protein AVEN_161004-1 [Araneus ventricosus]|uniref:Uncharacterized protein n=1 Tax=Araneus ventricosus TaxID=182803 RepID=A0A4Y2G0Y4_ARAVE|nr:hypothetical protein AVEN_161004-1 [Araneus ventricosus]
MTRTTPELSPPSRSFRTTPTGGRLTHYVKFNEQQANKHGGSSVESGFKPGTLRRDLLPRGHSGRHKFQDMI